MPTPTRKSVVSSLKWQTLAKILTQIVSWTSTILVMRILSPGDYGLMAMATVVIGLVVLISEMGIGSAIVQTHKIDIYQQRSLFGAALILNTACAVILALSAPLVAYFFAEPRLERLIPILAIQLPLSALSTLPSSIAKREMAFKTLSIIEMASVTISAIVTLASALNGHGVWSLIYGQIATAILTPLFLLCRFGTLWPLFGYKGLEKLLSFGTTITTNRILWYFYSQADMLIAGKILGKESLGAYSAAVTLATLPMQKISAIVNQIAFSSFARIQNDKAAIYFAATTSIKLMAFVSIPLLWGIATITHELILVALGEKWLTAEIPLQLIAIITPLRMLSALISTITVGLGKAKLDLINTLTLAIISIPLFIIGSYLWGIIGLGLAWLISYPICFLLILKRTLSCIETSIGDFFTALKYPILSGLCMIGIVQITRQLSEIGTRELLCIEILSGALTYITTYYMLDKDSFYKLKSIIQNR